MKISIYSQASALWLDYQKALTSYILSRVKDMDASNEIMQDETQERTKTYGATRTPHLYRNRKADSIK